MLNFLSPKVKNTRVGVDFLPTGVAVVEIATGRNNTGQVKRSDFLPSVGVSEQARVLKQWVQHHGLKNVPCVSLVAKHDVQLFQLEKPAVADEELLQAVTWKIKDLVNFDVETAVVDVFQLPPSPKSPVTLINAVVANESVVGGYVERILDSGLALKVLDVHDLVTKNFASLQEADVLTIALLHFQDNEGLLTIYHDRDLYVARDFRIGILDIESASSEDEAVYDSLLLEIQRSMDYFESTYGLGMVQKMLVYPHTPGSERMLKYLQNYVGYDVDFATIDIATSATNAQMDRHCFPAYCAALRGIS